METGKKKKKKAPRRKQIRVDSETAFNILRKMDSRDIVRVHHLLGILGLTEDGEVSAPTGIVTAEEKAKALPPNSEEVFQMMREEAEEAKKDAAKIENVLGAKIDGLASGINALVEALKPKVEGGQNAG